MKMGLRGGMFPIKVDQGRRQIVFRQSTVLVYYIFIRYLCIKFIYDGLHAKSFTAKYLGLRNVMYI